MTPPLTSDAMAVLHARCFVIPRPWAAAEFAAVLKGAGSFAVGDATGFALARVAAEDAELLTLAVAPEARRTGLGRHLLKAVADDAAARGATRLFLEVAADNEAACALYISSGFTETGRRPSYYRGPDGGACDALILSRAIGGG